MQRRRFLSTSAASALAATLGSSLAAPAVHAQGKLTPLKFTLDFRVTSQTGPFFLAESKGYYKEEGLDVTIDVGSGSVASITRVASGAYDLGLGDISALAEFHAQNADAPVQAIYQYYNRAPFVIIGRKDRGVTADFQSLKGKRVAAAAVESTRRSWPMVARQLNTSPELFQWVTTDFSARDNVMVRGDVDAATYFHDSAVSLFARMPPQDLAVLEYGKTGLNLYGNAILAGRLLQERPDAARAFLRATHRALRETLASPDAAMAAIKAREPILNMDMERARWAITRQYIATAETQAIGLGGVQPDVLARQIDEIATTFNLARKPAAERVFNPAFLPAAADRKVAA
ncbi:ABC-type nitrate/sulfonate/bicarbonate transport system, substrate-binding protein [Paracidovorax valerianellae]|uniref:Thiamine pyrimidine synthase n=1 Tax=Paracidovorax valerianellae TaxID=187868 RepID=A0A1G6SYU1_9BURK|nr:ABC transporter substrate-binding protein [Paracidovorax valerianellae]SDD22072.1 ABC-type nitrate/sulfonate/bicarbonate transport system, substrate-binding protein [Paracidovorax valerianellae]